MIHKSSVIDSKAKISNNVRIGPFCYVGPNVTLNENVELVSNVHIEGSTTIGKGTKIFPFASIGTQPQDLKFKGEYTTTEIGDNTVIREHVSIHRATEDNWVTKVGANCLIMGYVHIAHDCVVGDHCILANYTGLSGHNVLEDHVTG